MVSNEEKKKDISTSEVTLPPITKAEQTVNLIPAEEKTTVTSVPETTKPDEEVTIQPIEPTTEEHKVDMDYYVDYEKTYALNIGLTYDIENTECLDNPISVTSKTTSAIANIEIRLNRYKNIEGFESVCVWHEKRGELYIGYT